MHDFTDDFTQKKLEENREALKREIRKELKIKEGAENLRKATTDKKALENVNKMVKVANTKLDSLNQQLQELNFHQIAKSDINADSGVNIGGVANVCGNVGSAQVVANTAMTGKQHINTNHANGTYFCNKNGVVTILDI